MSLKFAQYAAFAEAEKQVSREMKEFRQTFGTDAHRPRANEKAVAGSALSQKAVQGKKPSGKR